VKRLGESQLREALNELDLPVIVYTWQDNLRAVALGLEALRRVERYGIAQRGEQYAGWRRADPRRCRARRKAGSRGRAPDAGLHG
jgi:hypothetical protein